MELPEALKSLRAAYKQAADTDNPATLVQLPQEVAFTFVHWHMAVVRRKERQYAAIARERRRAEDRAARKAAREARAMVERAEAEAQARGVEAAAAKQTQNLQP